MRGAIPRICVFVLLAIGLGACAAALTGYPERVSDVNDELKSLEPFYNNKAVEDYTKAVGNARKPLRDAYVFAKMRAIDIRFGTFQEELFTQGVSGGILANWIELGLGSAGAVFSGPSQALSAASTGVVGAKSAFDKEAYFENTLPTLLGAMEANRKTIKLRIYSGITQNDSDYSLPNAMADLEDYYSAGTIPGALISINEDTGAKGKEAQESIRKVLTIQRNAGFLAPDAINRIQAVIQKIQTLSDGDAIALSKQPPTSDANSETAVQNQDPNNRRFTTGGPARITLVTRARTDPRTDGNLTAWERALGL